MVGGSLLAKTGSHVRAFFSFFYLLVICNAVCYPLQGHRDSVQSTADSCDTKEEKTKRSIHYVNQRVIDKTTIVSKPIPLNLGLILNIQEDNLEYLLGNTLLAFF